MQRVSLFTMNFNSTRVDCTRRRDVRVDVAWDVIERSMGASHVMSYRIDEQMFGCTSFVGGGFVP